MNTTLIIAGAALAVTAMLCTRRARAWRGWLELRSSSWPAAAPAAIETDEDVGVRIELAAVRERLKKLEAIASGVEL